MKPFSTKHLLLAAFLAIAWQPAQSQLVFVRQVISASGGTGVAGGIRFDYTIGEAVVSPLSAGPFLLTQGFQQPEVLPPAAPGAMPIVDFTLFPNPALTTFKIQFSLLTNASVSYLLLNTAGQVIFQDIRNYAPGKVVIPTSVDKLAAGIYTVMLKVNAFVFTEKLIVQ